MIVCTYNRFVSKDDKPYELDGQDSFKTADELTAHRIIGKWNYRGKIQAKKYNIFWRYDFVSSRQATIEEMDDTVIASHTEGDC